MAEIKTEKGVKVMLFKRYKCLELEKINASYDEHNSYEAVWNVRAYNNKKKKGESRIVAKVIRDSYGRVFRVYVEPKAKKKKEIINMLEAAYQTLSLDDKKGEQNYENR